MSDPTRMIMLGPPGAGKGTQATLLSQKLNVPQISTGEMLRRVRASGSDLGHAIEDCLKRGELVPDELMMNMVAERIHEPDCANGFLLDGYPRTLAQAINLSESDVHIDYVIEFVVPDEVIVKRMAGRRIHKGSGRIYHIEYNPPTIADHDDVTGEPLIQRGDDNPEVVQHRLNIYRELTQPVVEYYHQRLSNGHSDPKLVTVKGDGPIYQVFQAICDELCLDSSSAA